MIQKSTHQILICALSLLILPLGCGPTETPVKNAKSTVTVKRVMDGHSLELNDGRTVRLIGVDTPKLEDKARNIQTAADLGADPVLYTAYAQKAKDFLVDLVEGKEVRTEIDPINQITLHHDKNARFLAYLYVEDLFVNAEMLSQGYGVTHRQFQFRQKERFLELEQEAKENGRGLWG